MNPFEWTFDGWGTAVLSCLLTALLGIVSYTLVCKTKIKQTQKAGKNSKQKQVAPISEEDSLLGKSKKTNIVIQKQTAGDNSEQTQTGGDKHGN